MDTKKERLTYGPTDTDLDMPLATVLRVVVTVMLLDGHISEMDVGIVDVFSVVIVPRVAEASKSVCISAFGWYNVRESERSGRKRAKFEAVWSQYVEGASKVMK